MRISSIICELNPLHEGHKYIMNYAKSENGQPLVLLMSGNYVQRGEPAITDKWTRTKCAIDSGADLVIELPDIYSTAPAEYFAQGAVNILNSLGLDISLFFGVEEDSYEKTLDFVNKKMSDENAFVQNVRKSMSEGASYCSSASDFLGSNNILAGEYLSAIKRTASKIQTYPVARFGNTSENECGTSLRRKILECNDGNYTDLNSYEEIILFWLRCHDAEEIATLPYISEGLENKIKNEGMRSSSLGELIDSCVSKRYVKSRIKRILVSVLTGIRNDDVLRYKNKAPFAHILGFNKTGENVLREITECANIPVFVQNSEAPYKLKGDALLLWNKEIQATSVYSLGFKNRDRRRGNAELTTPLVKIN